MKLIAFLPSLGIGGAERVTAALCSHWAGIGWEVCIATLATQSTDRYPLHPAVRRVAFGLAFDTGSAWGAISANLRRVVALRRLIVREQPDAVLAMMGTPSVLLALASIDLGSVVTVGSERIHPPRLPLGRAWERLRAESYRLLDAVVAQTDRSAEWLRSETSARRVEVIPNPVVIPLPRGAPFRSPTSVGVAGRRRLLAVGRLARQKGFDLLITAFSEVAARRPEWELVIVGEGEEEGPLQSQISHLGLDGRVILAGSAGNLGDWYTSCDCFVLSSRFEGFPNALLEALAHDRPAVAVDCETGPAELLRHEVDGLLVPPDDAAALSAALDRVMGDPALLARLARRAGEVRARFSLEATATRWEQLLAARGRQAP